jgi:putative ABC transport system permease protein
VPNTLLERGGFQFAMTEASTAEERANPWLLLDKALPDGAIPIFVEQNTAMWMLKTMLGGTVEVPDDAGATVKCRIVGTLLDNVFQSELLMSDAAFRTLYPREEGFRVYLVQTDRQHEREVTQLLSAGLANVGMSVTPSRERVSNYQAVIGTYLTTFQLLGGLGLLLGILGLAIVILRNVWERISELALLRAFGYTPQAIRTLVLGENLFLLALGVVLGVGAAIISVLPHLALGGQLPWSGIVLLIVLVAIVGVCVVALATRNAVRIPLLSALRKE